jgi:hypothetical protein
VIYIDMKHIIKSIRKLTCPECESTDIRNSSLNDMQGPFSKIFLQTYRCRDCRVRFIGLQRGVSFLLKGIALSGAFVLTLSVIIIVLITASRKSAVVSADSGDFLRNLRRAGQGETAAQLNVGLMYLNGKGTDENHREAVLWLEKAAGKGNAAAMYHLGKYYSDHDRPGGIKLIRQAAEQGQVEAQYRLGMLYYRGTGVIQDYEAGAGWVRRAADRGMTDAMYQMGLLCLTGKGVAVDHLQSYVWFNLAAAQGRKEAVKQRELVAGALSLDELVEAQRRSRNFRPVLEQDTPDELIANRGTSH